MMFGDAEMVQLMVHITFLEDPSSVPNIHVRWFTITCKSSSRAICMGTCTYVQMHTHPY